MIEFAETYLDQTGGRTPRSRSPGGGPRPAKLFKGTRKEAKISLKLSGSDTGGKSG